MSLELKIVCVKIKISANFLTPDMRYTISYSFNARQIDFVLNSEKY